MVKIHIGTKQDRMKLFLKLAYPITTRFIEDFNKLLEKPLSRQRVFQLVEENIKNYEHLKALETLGLNIDFYLYGNYPIFADNDRGKILSILYDKAKSIIEINIDNNPAFVDADDLLKKMLKETVFEYVGKVAATGTLNKSAESDLKNK